MWQSLPEFGTGVLYAILVAAAYTFAVAIIAGRTRRPRFLESARFGAYGTAALIGLGTLILAYAFVTHDFRLRYVAHYSDRTMPLPFLFAALWGGQDGSLLWWTFLLSLYTTACVVWLKGKYRDLQPYVIATLMSIVGFFVVLMLFAANPFWTTLAGAKADGEGLNPLLQNFYMAIHPPSLYTGFVGCSVPFAFGVAALVTGRLDNEWIIATRKWMLFAWMFLSIGNVLGMLWAYEELGWGGYWAWDPVENAACLPWWTASAFLHSTMTQERRGMLKVWNVVLVCVTFFLTIFGTFLTRSGMISSVHSFAQSDIGKYFVWYMGFLIAAASGLIVWRLPQLRSEGKVESVASREAAFVFNNWALLGIMTFIAVATVFPKISALWGEEVTVGPPFFNRWVAPAGLFVVALMGAGPLFGWRKTSEKSILRGFTIPTIVMVVVALIHIAIGSKIGFPAMVENPEIYPGFIGTVLQKLGAIQPVLAISLAAFNIAVVVQEYSRGIGARRKTNPGENIFSSVSRLIAKNRRRYGGYIVHAGIGVMVIGFTGKAWGIDKETSLKPGQTFQMDHYQVRYDGTRMELDAGKRMIFADLTIADADGKEMGKISPAKFIYRKMPESPTTEVAMLHTIRDDLYAVLGSANPDTKVATFQLHLNPLVSWIWFGAIILIFGSVIALWPEVAFAEAGVWGYARTFGSVTGMLIIGLMLAGAPSRAYAQGTSSLHAGTVEMHSAMERDVFPLLICQCGACARLSLANCVCSTADEARTEVRSEIAAGLGKAQIFDNYVAKFGTAALAVPPNRGKLRSIYAVPALVFALGGIAAVLMVRKWKKKGDEPPLPVGTDSLKKDDEYEKKLDEELRRLDG